MVEVMFWRIDNTAITVGYQSKFHFGSMEEAENFVRGYHLEDCHSVSFYNEETGEYYEADVIKEVTK